MKTTPAPAHLYPLARRFCRAAGLKPLPAPPVVPAFPRVVAADLDEDDFEDTDLEDDDEEDDFDDDDDSDGRIEVLMSRQLCADCGIVLSDPDDLDSIDVDRLGMFAREMHFQTDGRNWSFEVGGVLVCGKCYEKRKQEGQI